MEKKKIKMDLEPELYPESTSKSQSYSSTISTEREKKREKKTKKKAFEKQKCPEVLDLDSLPHEIELTNNLQQNLKLIEEKYGKSFCIKNEDVVIPVKLYIKKGKRTNNYNHYVLIYNAVVRYSYLLPLVIDFIDIYKNEKNNNCYIKNIHKTNKATGTEIVRLTLKFLELLSAQKVTLHDAVTVKCWNKKIDLSFYKLIESCATFYHKFGFRMTIGYAENLQYNFGSDEQLNQAALTYVKEFKSIKLEDIEKKYSELLKLITEIIANQDYKEVKIYLIHDIQPYLIDKNNVRGEIFTMLDSIDEVLGIIKNSKKIFLYKLLAELFYSDCMNYSSLFSILVKNYNYVKIIYKNKEVKFDHVDSIYWLRVIRNNSTLELDLTQKQE